MHKNKNWGAWESNLGPPSVCAALLTSRASGRVLMEIGLGGI